MARGFHHILECDLIHLSNFFNQLEAFEIFTKQKNFVSNFLRNFEVVLKGE
ncbi:uncharacterized protein G2W53_033339 [Senna tora]|uniref:Uncharacterized protein n=1 Tax=Senna tora TaxID=362788 RepID=A0A834SXD3_9FABA|nr:uncharacterized protein G2W53_033339 [Senna tora]